jgi:hypothetical protein
MECYFIEQGTVRDLIIALEKVIAKHGNLPILFEDDGSILICGNICVYDRTEDRGLEEDEAPYLRAVISG